MKPCSPRRAWRLVPGILAVVAALSLLTACQRETPPDEEQKARVSGRLTPGLGNPAAEGAAAEVAWTHAADAEFVPGDVLVGFWDSLEVQQAQLSAQGRRLELVRPLAGTALALYRSAGLSPQETLELARALTERGDVRYAHPNYILKPMRVPNDPLFPRQWHFPAINLPQAWDITVGSAETVVAVVDSGLLRHSDLGETLPGYDFISDPTVARDGDGRDPDPFDEGDTPGGQSSYHGTHLVGVIAARTDNGVGVAGVSWRARILPVRALGVGGGSMLDVMEGMIWAAGLSVEGVPDNPTPAQVINLSLGGPGTCYPAMQRFISQALGTGAIIVAAAGNESQNAADVSPASCRGVIAVGATEQRGRRAPYSNYGTRVDVMAPGGDMTTDRDDDGDSDGVLSTQYDDFVRAFGYDYQHGTSMATAHVSGVFALMKALKPELSAAEALIVLRDTARPLSASACARPKGSECGAGLVDAHAALWALQDDAPPPVGSLSLSPNPLEFARDETERSVTLHNTGEGALEWSVVGFVEAPDNPAPLPAGSVFLPGAPRSGTLAPGVRAQVAVAVDRSRVRSEGLYQLQVIVLVDGAEVALDLRFRVVRDALPALRGPMSVTAYQEDAQGELVQTGVQRSAGVLTEYSLLAEPGDTFLVAWSDENGNGVVDQGDYLGTYPEWLELSPGEERSSLDFTLEQVVGSDPMPVGRLGALLTLFERERP